MFRIDFHSHTGHSPDAAVPAASLLDGAVRAGLATLCVTDHNTIDGGRQAASIVARRPDRYPGLSVIIGEEVMTSEGEADRRCRPHRRDRRTECAGHVQCRQRPGDRLCERLSVAGRRRK
ncbi:MAG: PHP domain-containing protein [Chloroflexi bacterium]|nr:PHP domain-containing protein [Chloroflexota bacterium]